MEISANIVQGCWGWYLSRRLSNKIGGRWPKLCAQGPAGWAVGLAASDRRWPAGAGYRTWTYPNLVPVTVAGVRPENKNIFRWHPK